MLKKASPCKDYGMYLQEKVTFRLYSYQVDLHLPFRYNKNANICIFNDIANKRFPKKMLSVYFSLLERII